MLYFLYFSNKSCSFMIKFGCTTWFGTGNVGDIGTFPKDLKLLTPPALFKTKHYFFVIY